MTNLKIKGETIEQIPMPNGEVWRIPIQKAHTDSEGSWVGIRESLIKRAIKDEVALLSILVEDVGIEVEVTPQAFKQKSKELLKPSKFANADPFRILLYPISEKVRKKNEEKLKVAKKTNQENNDMKNQLEQPLGEEEEEEEEEEE